MSDIDKINLNGTTYNIKTDSSATETDPTVPSYVKNISQQDISNWNGKSNFSGSYNDLTDKPTIPSEVTETTVSNWGFTKNTGTYSKPSGGIPSTDMTSEVQTSLGKADSALQSHQDISGKQDVLIAGSNITIASDGKTISATDTTYSNATTGAAGLMSAEDKTKLNGIASGATANTGTITSVKMNGSTIASSGEADLGTVITQHQDISGKLNTSQVKNATSTTAGDVYDVRYINSVLGDVNTALEAIINGGW